MGGTGVASAWTGELVAWLEAEALRRGFDRAGVAAIYYVDHPVEQRDGDRFAAWVDAGRAGEMGYLKRRDEEGKLLRSSVRIPMHWARSVVICAVNYNAGGPRSIEAADAGAGWIARYAWSGRRADQDEPLRANDYHDELLTRLRGLEEKLRERTGAQTRCYVDTGPVVERSLAARAGVGWIGKNTCVLNQELGSWLLLATIVTSLEMAPEALMSEAADRCGSCTRCIDACPTAALVAPREMDASRCIAYLTIEKKGSIPEELRSGVGRQIFGCDICQEVCPWNRRAPLASEDVLAPRHELVNPDLEDLARMDPPGFRKRFRGSPLERTGLKRLQRNVAIAMGNSGEERFRQQLTHWAEGEDAVLAETALWAMTRLRVESEAAEDEVENAGEKEAQPPSVSASISKAVDLL